MSDGDALRLVFEIARADSAGDPYAFQFAPQNYLLRSEGGAFETSRMDWNGALLADLDAVRQSGRDPEVVQRLGDMLRQFLAPLHGAQQESRILAALAAAPPSPPGAPDDPITPRVVVTIRMAAAELFALPWELLTLRTTGQHLGEIPGVLLRYEWPETTSAPLPTAPGDSERILFAWSAASGAVPATEQLAAISDACRAGNLPFSDTHDVLPHASCSRLLRALSQAQAQGRPIAVLHLLCHGAEAGSSFGLGLDGDHEGDGPTVVDAGRLRQLLAPFAPMVRCVVLSACDSGNSGALASHLGSIAQTLHRAGFASVLASRYPLSVVGSIRMTETLYRTLLGRPASLESAFLAARRRLAEDTRRFDWASLQLYGHLDDGDDSRPLSFRPYRGLLSFQPEHARFFFGRQAETDQILRALRALQAPTATGKPRVLIVAGASGTGKSSVVLAGVVPQLLANPDGPAPRILRMRPGEQPLATLDALLAPRPAPPDASPAASDPKTAQPTLLVVDQLEEIFTHTTDAQARQAFVQRLFSHATAPASTSTALSVLCTLRVDFIGHCGDIVVDHAGHRLDGIAYDEAHRVFIGQLSPTALRLAIEEPARRVGLRLEEGLASRLLEAVASEPGALPLLADTLDILWGRRVGRLLTQQAYEQIGGVAGALRGRAEALLASLNPDEVREARRLLVRLVRIDSDVEYGTRRRGLLSKLRPQAPAAAAPLPPPVRSHLMRRAGQATADHTVAAARFDHVLRRFVDARLLVLDGEGDLQTVEIVHEALIRGWSRLSEWVQGDRQMMLDLEKLDRWVAAYDEHGTLLSNGQLALAESIAEQYPGEPSPAAQQLLDRSRGHQFLWRTTKRALVIALLGGFVVVAGLWWSARVARQQASVARDSMLSLLHRASDGPPSAPLLLTLARVKLNVEAAPSEALAAIERAYALAPGDPDILAERVACLLFNVRMAESITAAQGAWPLLREPAAQVNVAVLAWAAARLIDDEKTAAHWAEQALTAYIALPPGDSALNLHPSVVESLLRKIGPQSPRRAVLSSELVGLITVLSTQKSPATVDAVRKLLGRPPAP